MYNYPNLFIYLFLTGTDNWTEFTNVLDVPKDAERIAFGILLKG